MAAADTLADPSVAVKLAELVRLHDEAFEHMMRMHDACKPSDGWVSVNLTNVHERDDDPLVIENILVYAQTVGTRRHNYFDTVDEALAAVRGWHQTAMAAED